MSSRSDKRWPCIAQFVSLGERRIKYREKRASINQPVNRPNRRKFKSQRFGFLLFQCRMFNNYLNNGAG